ncbi:tyrosine-type recombinase/integrase [Arthrobacter sp. CC3]|uniref:tyrosine-type recombinase/integrase n=1 Tax=Arthrobacter sp. CC3 TaxID=3029185 RepID=UPI003263CA32
MASPRDIRRTDGSTAFKILWRKPDGTQTSKTFDDPNVRDLVLELMNANGDNYALVDQAVAAAQRKSPTVEAIMTAHLDGMSGVEPGTVHRYRQLSRNHIVPGLGNYPVDAVTRQNVTDWFNGLGGGTLAAKTRKNIHALLSAAFETAIRAGHLSENVAKGVRDSKAAQAIKTRENVFLSRAEFEHLCGAMDSRYVLFLRVLAGTGLRFSEATALRKRDVKLTADRYTAAVTRAWKKTDQGYVIGGPKTVKGRRSVALPTALTPALTGHLSGLKANDLIFTLPDGGRLANNRFHENYWDDPVDGLAAAALLHDTPTIHDLRHTHASWLLNAGVPITVVSRRLGHESIKTTVDTYGHLLNDADSSAADAIG